MKPPHCTIEPANGKTRFRFPMPDRPRFSLCTDYDYQKKNRWGRYQDAVEALRTDLDHCLGKQGKPEWETAKWEILKLFPYHRKTLERLECFQKVVSDDEVNGETLIGELLDRYLKDYDRRGLKNARKVRSHVVPVRQFFANKQVKDLTLRMVEEFKDRRMNTPVKGWREKFGKGAARATVNQNLQVLLGAFKLAKLPIFKLPFENLEKHPNQRKGFFEPEDVAAYLRHMPPWLHNLVKVDYIIGWRMSELLGIQTDQLNFKLGTLTLYESKNGEGRVFTFAVFPELREYLEEQFHSTNKWRVANQFQATALFHREGKPIAYTTFWKYWKLARDKVNQERLEAGQPPLARVALAHDFRRTAARNMRARGVPTEMIMELVGWKTFKMLRRYLIVDTASLNQATAQLAAGGRLIPANSPADYPSDPLAQEKPQQIQGNSLP